jgi:diaminopimelate decarboxylase
LVIEPGRWLVAEAGILISEVLYTQSNPYKNFLIVDAAMTELIRPALYEAYHPIFSCQKRSGKTKRYDVVGPVCETSDFLGLNRRFGPIHKGDFIWIGLAGAYGSSMASEYNLRPKAAELIVE